MLVAVVDYGSGNLRSAQRAAERAAADLGLSADVVVTDDAAVVARADRIVLPGQGAFESCMGGLRAVPGMVEALEDAVLRRGRPLLGICVGMQLFADRGLEHGVHQGLGWIGGEIVPLEPSDPALKIPHMGWNALRVTAPDHPVMAGVADGDHVYFVHSYRFAAADRADVLATSDYGGEVAAVVGRGTMVGTQFHPEKSQATGIRLVRNFLAWSP
jgi:glutamine amidotransferase